jgi:hypothetical protein
LLVHNPELSKEWDYERNKSRPEDFLPNSDKKAYWKCNECGHKWEAVIGSRHVGRGCPQCKKSKGEKRIKEYLDQNNIFNNPQYIFNDLLSDLNNPLRFDFAIFWNKEKTQLKILIEFDGEQHDRWIKSWMPKNSFIKLQYHDKLKNEYCKNNNIPLLRIKWYDFDNIEEILDEYLHNINIKITA